MLYGVTYTCFEDESVVFVRVDAISIGLNLVNVRKYPMRDSCGSTTESNRYL